MRTLIRWQYSTTILVSIAPLAILCVGVCVFSPRRAASVKQEPIEVTRQHATHAWHRRNFRRLRRGGCQCLISYFFNSGSSSPYRPPSIGGQPHPRFTRVACQVLGDQVFFEAFVGGASAYFNQTSFLARNITCEHLEGSCTLSNPIAHLAAVALAFNLCVGQQCGFGAIGLHGQSLRYRRSAFCGF
jgi:hypothetical protein